MTRAGAETELAYTPMAIPSRHHCRRATPSVRHTSLIWCWVLQVERLLDPEIPSRDTMSKLTMLDFSNI